MKRLLFATAFAALVFPLSALAATFHAGPTVTYGSQESIEENLYSVGGTQFLNATTGGDVVAAGGTLSLGGRVGGDILAAGGTVQLLGPVLGDARILGGTITINSRIDGDLVIAGGTVTLLPDAVVAGDVNIAGGTVHLAGTVHGATDVRAGELTIVSTARLDDTLIYHGPREAIIETGARVTGPIQYIPSKPAPVRQKTIGAWVWAVVAFMTALRTLVFLGATLVAVWFWRRQLTQLLHDTSTHVWPSAGRGVVYGILVPIASILLIVSVIGAIPGVLGLMLYGASIMVAKVVVGILFGAWISKIASKRAALEITWANAILGVIGFQFLGLIPILGGLAAFVLTLAVFGALADAIRRKVVAFS